ncbi:RDD family protein [Lusitaniella coriacea LEGE 07157]|uniref:RDD family protein n=1 Tax=Lusitaniella coriacea LEGE 07157 TaxID=945747 RepID=A0A8J7DXH9_9CYAN|nr:RDD family protein [Lusitaniella coriacea]MBE9116997.1 RDD family protein [Lusitaniella coriacea LEGE 07157]
MYDDRPPLPSPKRFPRVPPDRRFYAFLIDFVAVWIVSSIGGSWLLQAIIFAAGWFGLRVVLVTRNQGQSLGSWAMDMKVIDLRFRRIPDIVTLGKREAILGFTALLAMTGLNIFFVNAFSTLLLVSPLLANCGTAFADEQYNQALHDRVAGTATIQTKRGFSLDLRTRQLLDEIKYRMRK